MSDESLKNGTDEPEDTGGEGGASVDNPQAVPRESAGIVLASATVVFVLGIWLAVWFPVTEKAYTSPTETGREREVAAANLDTPEAKGRKVYIREGCWNCHSQNVRPIQADAYLGPVSAPGDYAYDDPQLIGSRRVGPDLTHFAGRDGTKDPPALIAHLKDPRESAPWSVMPSYSNLSDDEMANLVSYLSTLK